MKTLISALALGALAPLALAQGAAKPATSAKEPRIAVINMQRVSEDSLLGKNFAAQLDALKNQIESEQTKKQNELNKMDAGIKAMQDELEKQQSVLSPDALDKKRQDIVKKSRDRQAFLEDGQQELQRMRERAQQQANRLQSEFQAKIKPFIDEVAKERGIDILVDSQMALAVSKDFDVSQDVIVKADDAFKASSAKPAAPAAKTPAPAPTPSPKP